MWPWTSLCKARRLLVFGGGGGGEAVDAAIDDGFADSCGYRQPTWTADDCGAAASGDDDGDDGRIGISDVPVGEEEVAEEGDIGQDDAKQDAEQDDAEQYGAEQDAKKRGGREEGKNGRFGGKAAADEAGGGEDEGRNK